MNPWLTSCPFPFVFRSLCTGMSLTPSFKRSMLIYCQLILEATCPDTMARWSLRSFLGSGWTLKTQLFKNGRLRWKISLSSSWNPSTDSSQRIATIRTKISTAKPGGLFKQAVTDFIIFFFFCHGCVNHSCKANLLSLTDRSEAV